MKKGTLRNSAGYASHQSPKSPSWIIEREAMRLFSDRLSRTILAVYHARRSAQSEEFFVPPQIAKLNRLTPTDLNWALDKLEGKLLSTVNRKKGKWRKVRLLPEFEKEVTSSDKTRHCNRGVEGVLLPDEERLSYDKDRILELAFDPQRKTSDEIVEALTGIVGQKGGR